MLFHNDLFLISSSKLSVPFCSFFQTFLHLPLFSLHCLLLQGPFLLAWLYCVETLVPKEQTHSSTEKKGVISETNHGFHLSLASKYKICRNVAEKEEKPCNFLLDAIFVSICVLTKLIVFYSCLS